MKWIWVFFGVFACSSQPRETILAHVGNETITASDLQASLAEQKENYSPDLLHSPEGLSLIKKKTLNDLIQKKILLQTANEKGIQLTLEEEKDAAQTIPDGYEPWEFEKTLSQKGISLDEWRRRQKEKKTIAKLMDREVYGKIPVSEQEIRSYYHNNPQLFRESERVRCRHIVAGEKEKAEAILSLLKKGENFANVAQKYSESPDREKGGDLGYLTPEAYPAIFIEACSALAPGETSEIVASEYGFHIFRALDKKPASLTPLSEVSADIRRQLVEKKAETTLQEWLGTIQRSQKIVIDERALEDVSWAP